MSKRYISKGVTLVVVAALKKIGEYTFNNCRFFAKEEHYQKYNSVLFYAQNRNKVEHKLG